MESTDPPKTNRSGKLTAILPLKIGLLPQKERLVFQPSIFRCYASFREGAYPLKIDSWVRLKNLFKMIPFQGDMSIFRGTCGFLGNSSEGNCLWRECDVSS